MRRIKQFLCKIFFGHRYKDVDRRCTYDEKNRTYIFVEKCCKCGKETYMTVHERNFF